MLTQRPRGTADVLPATVAGWQRLEQVARDTFRLYHFEEVRTPIFEHTEVFVRGVGETTDIVEKEMYTFMDKGDRSITLRPEGTAGVVRAYVENKLYGQPGASKLYYIGPMFRYENPQKGRQRQLHQYGCEVLGAPGPDVDAEVIALNIDILERLGLSNLSIELNSVGCSVCRPVHKEKMLEVLRPVASSLCAECQSRLERNPLRIFDCKNQKCQAILKEQGAPTILDALCDECQTHFDGVKKLLYAYGIPYVINAKLVRGLDYYTRTAWEVTAPGFPAIAGGGRYNGLVSSLGGPETPGIGFAGGMERALMVLGEQEGQVADQRPLDVYVAVAGSDGEASMAAAKLLQRLRKAGLTADRDYQGRGLKAQFKAADRARARYAMVLGEDEIASRTVTVKNLQTGEQQTIPDEQVISILIEGVTHP